MAAKSAKKNHKAAASRPAKSTARKKALGRGIDALIPDFESLATPPEGAPYRLCDAALIHPNRFQPRQRFDPDELEELVGSIREKGVIQPLLVRPDEVGFELIAGERRLRAARMAGLSRVPVVVREISDTELLELSIIENIQRRDLNAMEEADAYHRLMDEFGLTQEQVSARVGKSRPAVANMLRLRQLPAPIRNSLRDGEISMGHARALLAAEGSARQTAAWQMVRRRGLSVRQTETLVKQLNAGPPADKPPSEKPEDIYFRDLADSLSRRLGTRVAIKRRGRRGKLEIEFYGDDDLNRLIGLLEKVRL